MTLSCLTEKRMWLFGLALLAPAVLHATLAPGGDPDFSGTWRLDPERSELRAMPAAHPSLLKIKQEGTRIHCFVIRKEEEPALNWDFSSDRTESYSKAPDTDMRTIAKWEGAALLINTIVNERSRSYTQMDRWKLSRDGRTLTVTRQIVSRHGEMESVLVFNRQ